MLQDREKASPKKKQPSPQKKPKIKFTVLNPPISHLQEKAKKPKKDPECGRWDI